MLTHKQLLLIWLKKVYLLENDVIKTLKKYHKDAQGHPEILKGIEMHLDQTQQRVVDIENCINRLNGKFKIRRVPHEGKILKNMVTEYGLSFMEIASYKTLISMALHFGDQETVSVCHGILKEEGQSARNIDKVLPQIIQDFTHEASPKED